MITTIGPSTNRWQDLHINGIAYFGQNGGTSTIRPSLQSQLSVGTSGKQSTIHTHANSKRRYNKSSRCKYFLDLVVTGNIVANSITDINFDDFTPQMPTLQMLLQQLMVLAV